MNKFGHAVAALLVSAISLAGCSPEQEVSMAPPKNISDLLANLRMAIDKNQFMRNGFYSSDNLKIEFGANALDKMYVAEGKPAPFTRYFLKDFTGIMPSPRPYSGILSMQLSKTTGDGKEDGDIVSVRGSINILSDDDALSVSNATKALGSDFEEDKKAENDVFLAISREAFNPPAQPHFIITYELDDFRYSKKITVDFGPKGRLWLLQFSQERK
jgi:hypothetical protein